MPKVTGFGASKAAFGKKRLQLKALQSKVSK